MKKLKLRQLGTTDRYKMRLIARLAASIARVPDESITHAYIVTTVVDKSLPLGYNVMIHGTPCRHAVNILQQASEKVEKAQAQTGIPDCGR